MTWISTGRSHWVARAGVAFSLTLNPSEPVAADVIWFGVSTVAAVAAAALSALSSYAPLRSLAAAGLAGGVGWAACAALHSTSMVLGQDGRLGR